MWTLRALLLGNNPSKFTRAAVELVISSSPTRFGKPALARTAYASSSTGSSRSRSASSGSSARTSSRREIRDGWTWGEIRRRVHERDGGCARCGSHRRLKVHRRIALLDGGSNELSNLELLCARCHRR
jgi:5-methylcytosine-specific restriction endonuclease McrA